MKFNELTNEELVYTYIVLGDILAGYEETLSERGIKCTVDSPIGTVHLFKEFTDEEFEELDSSDRVRLFRSITEKLKPIVDLIKEGDPDLVDKVEAILDMEEDEEQEEDL